MERESWTEYFMGQAEKAASRSTCDRAHVGCILVRNKHLIATGYNGSPSGEPHCDDVGHLMVDGHCVATIHAEQNAINYAAHDGVSLAGCVAYVTHLPCWACAKNLFSAGAIGFVCKDLYRVEEHGHLIRNLYPNMGPVANSSYTYFVKNFSTVTDIFDH